MKVFISYQVYTTATIEKEVSDGATYEDIIDSISRDDLVHAEVQEVDWDALKYAWRSDDHPNVYKADEDGNINWSEQMED